MDKEIRIDESNLPSAVIEAIRDGRKLVAIKLLREATGLGLANAKVIVDRAAQEHSQAGHGPGAYAEESNNGRLLAMLLALMLVYMAYRWFLGA